MNIKIAGDVHPPKNGMYRYLSIPKYVFSDAIFFFEPHVLNGQAMGNSRPGRGCDLRHLLFFWGQERENTTVILGI